MNIIEVEIYDEVLNYAVDQPVPQFGEELCCENGCGVTTALPIMMATSVTRSREGALEEVVASRAWISACCKGGMFFYRDADGSQRDCE